MLYSLGLGSVLTGDFGISFRRQQLVLALVLVRLLATLEAGFCRVAHRRDGASPSSARPPAYFWMGIMRIMSEMTLAK